MAASLWVRHLESFCQPGSTSTASYRREMAAKGVRVPTYRHTCPNCKVKLSKSNPFVYSIGEYVRGRRRNIVDHVCRNCWIGQCNLSIRAGVDPDIRTLYCQRPHWMDLPWVEPRLTVEERWLLDELCQFDVVQPGFFAVLGVHKMPGYDLSNVHYQSQKFKGNAGFSVPVQFVQTDERQFDEDEMRSHPVRDWCEEHGVVIEESRPYYATAGLYRYYQLSFLLPRRDGQPHQSVEDDVKCLGCPNPCPGCVDPDTGMTRAEYRDAVRELQTTAPDDFRND